MSLTPEEIAYYEANASDDLRPNQIAACTCGIAFAVSAVVARMISRRRSRVKLGWDDYTICVALMGQLTYACLMALNVANGEGLHIIFLKDMRLFAQVYVGAIICYSITIMLTKISILIFYHRIFPVKWLTAVSYAMGVLVISYNLALIFVAAFQCIPLSSLWTGKPAQCINVSPPFLTLAIVNVVTDFAILALPIQPVLGLKMRTGRKIQVLSIFLLGGIVCIFGVIRCVALSTMKNTDLSYNAVYSGIWSYTEISVGIVAACMPTLRPLFKSRNRESKHAGDSAYSSNAYFARWKSSLGRSSASKGTDEGDIPLTGTGRSLYTV
ncbi:hypothetical protein ASPVEDRAFT_88293 [Aspergillus versicolor CBS 583.65]|uniref:Rhodopsin domain-containing protein n=1 Tax=Aspergillus versicolor CBS 583.65 TaxID=1036611 RepID=A0A1L9PZU2_ASPVE|nr:uncharacterized protein ASPVEDRAFT_88293 [Aspergillus versicolor CBS 583.65]OJJ07027.1 hypothetical protein ASPVEDRAFT_88293 [Aspergillus versicolor CBS 583.65]